MSTAHLCHGAPQHDRGSAQAATPTQGARAPRRTAGSSPLGRLAELGRAVGSAAAATRDAALVVGDAARVLCTPTGLAGAAVEAAWLTAHTVIYPIGLVGGRTPLGGPGYRIEHLGPVRRGRLVSDLEAADTPILLVHGIIDNRSVFTLLRRGLRRRGFGRVSTMNYSVLTGDVRVAAARLADEVEAIVTETGYERIHIVGHSMGGLIARYYVTRLGGDARVHTLVTLGTPHAGTYTAYGWPGTLTRQLRPGSGLMRELDRPVVACRTRFICYWADLDLVMFPQATAALEHPDLDATNIQLHGVGHTSIPIVGTVVNGIADALAHLDTDGRAVGADVTPLHRGGDTGGPGGAGGTGAGVRTAGRATRP